MTRAQKLEHEFVHYIPDTLEDGKLYVSVAFIVVLTGAEPSVMRAGAMSALTLVGLLLGRARSTAVVLSGAVRAPQGAMAPQAPAAPGPAVFTPVPTDAPGTGKPK